MGESKPSGSFSFLRRGLRRSKARGRSPSPEEVDQFLRKRVGSFKVAPPGASQFDEGEERFKAQDDVAVEDLEKIIEAHDADKDNELKVADSSWNTVFEQITAAKRRHEEKNGDGSKVTSHGVDIMSSYIDMIPEDYGLGILRGGLAIVFEATKRHEANRERIIDVFETLPDSIVTINTAHVLLEPDSDDTELQMEFLSMLVKDIPALIKILLGESPWYRKVVQFLCLDIPATSTIDEILGRWTRQITRLKEHIEKLKIQFQVRSATRSSTQLSEIADSIEEPETGIRAQLGKSHELQTAILQEVRMSTADLRKPLAEMTRNTKLYAELATIFREDMKSRRRDSEMEEELRQNRRQLEDARYEGERLWRENQYLSTQVESLSRQISGASSTDPNTAAATTDGPAITPMTLLGVLRIPSKAREDELIHAMTLSNNVDTALQSRALWLPNQPEFRNWLYDETSSLLLVDGCMGPPQLISALTAACCALAATLDSEAEDAAVAFFFAGLHSRRPRLHSFSSSDPNTTLLNALNNGPTSLLRNIIAQLLLNPKFPLQETYAFLTQETLQSCQQGDFTALCSILVRLLEQIPRGTRVFIIIDGISWFEQDPWEADLVYLASAFEHVVRNANAAASSGYGHVTGALKVLMTSPNRSVAVAPRFTGKPDSIWRHTTLAAGHAHPGGARAPIMR